MFIKLNKFIRKRGTRESQQEYIPQVIALNTNHIISIQPSKSGTKFSINMTEDSFINIDETTYKALLYFLPNSNGNFTKSINKR